jgi:hypothetical protein
MRCAGADVENIVEYILCPGKVVLSVNRVNTSEDGDHSLLSMEDTCTMTSYESSLQSHELSRVERKLNRRIRLLQGRLQRERELQCNVEKRLAFVQDKRVSRVQRLEAYVDAVRIQLKAMLRADDEARMAAQYQSSNFDASGQAIKHISTAPAIADYAMVLARHARAIADTTEEMARLATDRVSYAEKRMEHQSIGRHLSYEYVQLEAEARQVQEFARRVDTTADEAEQLAAALMQEEQNYQETTGPQVILQEEQNYLDQSTEWMVLEENTVETLAAAIMDHAANQVVAEVDSLSRLSRPHAQDVERQALEEVTHAEIESELVEGVAEQHLEYHFIERESDRGDGGSSIGDTL